VKCRSIVGGRTCRGLPKGEEKDGKDRHDAVQRKSQRCLENAHGNFFLSNMCVCLHMCVHFNYLINVWVFISLSLSVISWF